MPSHDKDGKKKVRRLVDVEVSHVSLVDRPANRTPFKFVKRDEGTETDGASTMNIMLKNMFGSRPAEVTSVIANTEAKALSVAKSIMEPGEIAVTEIEGLFVARKAGTVASPDERTVHLGKAAGVAYTVANLRKELVLYDMDGNDNFDDAVKKEGFVPGLMVGMDALHTTIRNIAMSEETSSADVFQTKVSKAIEQFGVYVDSLITSLPVKAFKFEKAMLAVAAPHLPNGVRPADGFNSEVYDMLFGKPEDAAPAEAAGDTVPGDAAATPDAAADAAPAPAGEAPEAPVAAATEPAAPAATPVAAAAPVAPDMAAILESAMAALTKDLGAQIVAAVKPLNDRMAAQDAAVATLSKALGTTVGSTPDADADGGNVIELAKGAAAMGGEPPLMDTAYRTSRNRG